MKKESFEQLISALQAQIERERSLQKALEPFFDGYIVSDISTGLQETIIHVLEIETNDPERNSKYGSLISWWLFDAPMAGQCKSSAWIMDAGDKKIPLETSGQLYDYLHATA